MQHDASGFVRQRSFVGRTGFAAGPGLPLVMASMPCWNRTAVVEFAAKKFEVVATLSGVLVFAGALVRGRKTRIDWAMAVGAFLLTIGFVLLAAAVFEVSYWLERHGRLPVMGSVGLGSILFTMGFAMDQLRHRSARAYQQQLAAMAESASSLPTETPDADA